MKKNKDSDKNNTHGIVHAVLTLKIRIIHYSRKEGSTQSSLPANGDGALFRVHDLGLPLEQLVLRHHVADARPPLPFDSVQPYDVVAAVETVLRLQHALGLKRRDELVLGVSYRHDREHVVAAARVQVEVLLDHPLHRQRFPAGQWSPVTGLFQYLNLKNSTTILMAVYFITCRVHICS